MTTGRVRTDSRVCALVMFIVSVQLGLLFLSPRDGGEAEELLTRQTLPVQTFALFGRVGVDPRTLSNQTRAEALAHLPLLPRHPHPRPRSGGEKKNKTTCLPSSGVSLMSSGLPRLLTTCSFSSTLPSPLPPFPPPRLASAAPEPNYPPRTQRSYHRVRPRFAALARARSARPRNSQHTCIPAAKPTFDTEPVQIHRAVGFQRY